LARLFTEREWRNPTDMPGQFLHQLFGDAARSLQDRAGSRAGYALSEAAAGDAPDLLTERELSFIALRDSVSLATVTANGWPYVQHRGGPKGFIRHLGGNWIGFATYRGNGQYISAGNLIGDARVAMIGLDYAARRRLKLIGHARILAADTNPALAARLGNADAGTPAGDRVLTATVIEVIGFDWNCPKYITPRFTRDEMDGEIAALTSENAQLRAELARLKESGK